MVMEIIIIVAVIAAVVLFVRSRAKSETNVDPVEGGTNVGGPGGGRGDVKER